MSDGVGERLQQRFAGRTVGVATLRGKDRVIGPALMHVLPLAAFNPIMGVDTDRFGAFIGEVQRIHDPLTTAKQKAQHVAEVSGMDLVIASEGSFGLYPSAPFVSCNEEFLVLYDAHDGAFFQHKHLSLETAFGGRVARVALWRTRQDLMAKPRRSLRTATTAIRDTISPLPSG